MHVDHQFHIDSTSSYAHMHSLCCNRTNYDTLCGELIERDVHVCGYDTLIPMQCKAIPALLCIGAILVAIILT